MVSSNKESLDIFLDVDYYGFFPMSYLFQSLVFNMVEMPLLEVESEGYDRHQIGFWYSGVVIVSKPTDFKSQIFVKLLF